MCYRQDDSKCKQWVIYIHNFINKNKIEYNNHKIDMCYRQDDSRCKQWVIYLHILINKNKIKFNKHYEIYMVH